MQTKTRKETNKLMYKQQKITKQKIGKNKNNKKKPTRNELEKGQRNFLQDISRSPAINGFTSITDFVKYSFSK